MPFGIIGRFDLAPVSGRNAAFNRNRSPLATRPSQFQVDVIFVARRHPSHSVALADDKRDGRDLELLCDIDSAHAFTQRSGFLRLEANHEAQHINEKDEQDVGGLAYIP
jgi:hypothetical protein